MKLFLLFLCSVLFACATAQNEEFLAAFNIRVRECQSETRATNAEVQNFINHKPPRTRRATCFCACLMKSMGVLRHGELDGERLEGMITEIARGNEREVEIGEEIIDECEDITVPRDECEAARLYNACLLRESRRRRTRFVFIWGPEL